MYYRDWEKIDNLRIDKYYTLVRMFIREALSFCRVPAAKTAKNDPSASAPKQKKGGKKRGKRNASEMDVDEDEAPQITPTSAEWDVELVELMSDVIEDEVLTLNPAPIGLRLHMADVWVDEASAACGDDMPTEAFLVALAPWLRAAASPETNAVVFRRTFEGVFEELLKHFPEEQDGEDVEEGEGDVDGKAMFKEVELSAVQACLFEVAAAPRVRMETGRAAPLRFSLAVCSFKSSGTSATCPTGEMCTRSQAYSVTMYRSLKVFAVSLLQRVEQIREIV